jgi:lysophospholipase L1-like esterase
MTTVVLFGDSMLGRFTKHRIDLLEQKSGPGTVVLNCAAGGWTSADGVRRVELAGRVGADVAVLSFGTNDCCPERFVGLGAYEVNLRTIAAALAPARLLGFLPPSMVELDGVGPRGRTNSVLETYRDVLRSVVGEAHAVETDDLIAPLIASGTEVYDDGLHLTGTGYAPLIRALARLIAGA